MSRRIDVVRLTGLLLVGRAGSPQFLYIGLKSPECIMEGTRPIRPTALHMSIAASTKMYGSTLKISVRMRSGPGDRFGFSFWVIPVRSDSRKLSGTSNCLISTRGVDVVGGCSSAINAVNLSGSTFTGAMSARPSIARARFSSLVSSAGFAFASRSAISLFSLRLFRRNVRLMSLLSDAASSLSLGRVDLRSLVRCFAFVSKALVQPGRKRGGLGAQSAAHGATISAASLRQLISRDVGVQEFLIECSTGGIVRLYCSRDRCLHRSLQMSERGMWRSSAGVESTSRAMMGRWSDPSTWGRVEIRGGVGLRWNTRSTRLAPRLV